MFLFISCKSRINSSITLDKFSTIDSLKGANKETDSVYKVEDILFTSPKNLLLNFYKTGHRPKTIKSKGDTIFNDNNFVLLADIKKFTGDIYKKFRPKYTFDMFAVKDAYTGKF